MSYVIQIFLPVYTAKKRRIPSSKFVATRKELTEKFGGLTAYSRAPAQGLWKKDDKTVRDDIVVFEVMVGSLAPRWWAAYKSKLKRRFDQDEVLIRAFASRSL